MTFSGDDQQCRLRFVDLQGRVLPEVRLRENFAICTWKIIPSVYGNTNKFVVVAYFTNQVEDQAEKAVDCRGWGVLAGSNNGDEQRWMEIVRDAFGDFVSDWKTERFVERYSSHPLFREDGFFFISHKDRYVATAFALQEEPHTSEGILHWLAVRPEYQQRGLGRALALCVLRYHKEHGKTSVSLKTEAYRDAAIELYKDIGFVMCGDQGRESLGI